MDSDSETHGVAAPLRVRPAEHAFAELAVVSLRHSVEIDGRRLPAGTKGTVVGAYDDGIGYEVEVFQPFHAVVTLEAADLSA